jgi:CheY-like chemotaxis protein
VVEDNRGDVDLFREALAGLDGVTVHAVPNVVQARDFLTRKPPHLHAPVPDVIFLDLNLPIFMGYSLLPAIKADPALRHIRIVVFTSSENPDDQQLCTELGADDYLVKPLNWPEWRSAVLLALG